MHGTAGAVPPALAVGGPAPGFHDLEGADGRRWSLASFPAHPVLALLFVGNGCPSVKAYAEELGQLQRAYGSRGVQLVAVNANNAALSPPDTLAEMARTARDRRWEFPYLKDAGGVLARACGATTTPQAFVFDARRRLRYRGRLADSRRPETAIRHDLAEALDDLVAGRPVRVPDAPALGCSIVW